MAAELAHWATMGCCTPDANRDTQPTLDTQPKLDERPRADAGGGSGPAERAPLPEATFRMGTVGPTSYPADGETHVHDVTVQAFLIDPHAVTNARFARFVEATGFVTDAERYGWSFVFGGLLPEDFEDTRGVANAPWWRQVFGAMWRHPEGPHSDLEGRDQEPVVHISHDDALAFCGWDESRLPTEAEWEYAARGGLIGTTFPWGDELEPGGKHRMNVWQGDFPAENTMEDGFGGVAPVDAFDPNGYGLYNMCGNVWEWCSDWFGADYYKASPAEDPQGPGSGERRVMRGGSYLCHASYCHRYRVGARSSNGPDSSTGNLGFRTVISAGG